MAANLVRNGQGPLTGFDPSVRRARDGRARGHPLCSELPAAIEEADVVIKCWRTGRVVMNVTRPAGYAALMPHAESRST